MAGAGKAIRYLSAVLAVTTATALAILWVSLGTKSISEAASWLELVTQIVPSLIAALVAYAAVYFILERQGVFHAGSAEERYSRIAKELFEYAHGDPSRGPGAEYDLSGRWRMWDWRHNNVEDRKLAFSESAQIYQDGRAVWGVFSTLQGPKRNGQPTKSYYSFKADLAGDILTGTWWQIKDKNPWKGAFQFKFIPGTGGREIMVGQWVGYKSDRTEINSGHWEWARPGHLLPSERAGVGTSYEARDLATDSSAVSDS
ncbi:MAG: hypothetical protein SX243_18595 [Acidobacteriota bacterium]|nr:hypothetical protein [Acidobacteriota bacterium]